MCASAPVLAQGEKTGNGDVPVHSGPPELRDLDELGAQAA